MENYSAILEAINGPEGISIRDALFDLFDLDCRNLGDASAASDLVETTRHLQSLRLSSAPSFTYRRRPRLASKRDAPIKLNSLGKSSIGFLSRKVRLEDMEQDRINTESSTIADLIGDEVVGRYNNFMDHDFGNEAETGEQIVQDLLQPVQYLLNLLLSKAVNKDKIQTPVHVQLRAQNVGRGKTERRSRFDYTFILMHGTQDNSTRSFSDNDYDFNVAFIEVKDFDTLQNCNWSKLRQVTAHEPASLRSALGNTAEIAKVLPQMIKYVNDTKCSHSLLTDGRHYVFMEWRKKYFNAPNKQQKYRLCGYNSITVGQDTKQRNPMLVMPVVHLMRLVLRGIAERAAIYVPNFNGPDDINIHNNNDLDRGPTRDDETDDEKEVKQKTGSLVKSSGLDGSVGSKTSKAKTSTVADKRPRFAKMDKNKAVKKVPQESELDSEDNWTTDGFDDSGSDSDSEDEE